jgi:hypothetical protein
MMHPDKSKMGARGGEVGLSSRNIKGRRPVIGGSVWAMGARRFALKA